MSQGDATYQLSKLYTFQFQRRRNLKFAVFVSIFQLVTPGTGSVLTPGALYVQTWLRSTRRCYIQNIKALGLPISEKNFEICLLCSYGPTCDSQGRTSPVPNGIIWTNLEEVHKELLHKNIKALGLWVLERKNYKTFVLCSYFQLVNPRPGHF